MEGPHVIDDEDYRKPWMTNGQWRAACCVAKALGGHHRYKKVEHYGDGVRIMGDYWTEFATYDSSRLTAFVVEAHRYHVRVAITVKSNRLCITAYPRLPGTFPVWSKHPDLQEAIGHRL